MFSLLLCRLNFFLPALFAESEMVLPVWTIHPENDKLTEEETEEMKEIV